MSRNVSLAQLRLRSLRRADMVTSTFVTPSEVNDVINDELCELYDMLVKASPPDYYAAETTYTTVPNLVSYELPANFSKLIAVYADEGSGQRRPILPCNEMDRAYYKPPQGTYSIIIRYVPNPPILADDADTFDGVSGWDALITARVARRLLQKRKTETGDLQSEIANKTEEIRNVARRDIGHPRYITDVDASDMWLYPNVVKIRGYAVIADNIEFYEPNIPFP